MMVPKPKPVKEEKSKKKRSVSERKQLVKQLDDLVSLIVRKRDGGCVTPGNCYGELSASHYYERAWWGVRWSLENVNCQCFSHNGSHRYHPFAYSEYMRKHYGDGIFAKLQVEEAAYRARHRRWQLWELRELLVKLQDEYSRMMGIELK